MSSTVKTLKVSFNNETRRFGADQPLLDNVETLKSHIKVLFQVPAATAISLFWRGKLTTQILSSLFFLCVTQLAPIRFVTLSKLDC
jgi:hypothetical protein